MTSNSSTEVITEVINNTPYWLDFWANVINSIAWPLVILIVLFFLFCNRKSIYNSIPKLSEFLKRTKSVSIGGATINFSNELAEIDEERELEPVSEELEKNNQNTDHSVVDTWAWIPNGFTSTEEFESLARLRPDFAVLDSWKVVESAINEIQREDGLSSPIPIFQFINILVKQQRISSGHATFIKNMSKLRNQVVHSKVASISYSDAVIYRKNCFEIIQILSNMQVNSTQENP